MSVARSTPRRLSTKRTPRAHPEAWMGWNWNRALRQLSVLPIGEHPGRCPTNILQTDKVFSLQGAPSHRALDRRAQFICVADGVDIEQAVGMSHGEHFRMNSANQFAGDKQEEGAQARRSLLVDIHILMTTRPRAQIPRACGPGRGV